VGARSIWLVGWVTSRISLPGLMRGAALTEKVAHDVRKAWIAVDAQIVGIVAMGFGA